MFVEKVCSAVRCIMFIDHHSRRRAAKLFGLSSGIMPKMCQFSLPPGYSLRQTELELIDRERDAAKRRICAGWFLEVNGFGGFDFAAITEPSKMVVLVQAHWEYILSRVNITVLVNSGTGNTHIAFALGPVACQKGFTIAFTTAAARVSQLIEARDER